MSSALFRSRFNNVEQARRFGAFCKDHNIITRGFVKVGMTPRGLRGLVAAKLIPINETVIVVPHRAFVTAFDAARNAAFVTQICGGRFPLSPDNVTERIGGSFLYVHQAILGYYMADVLLSSDDSSGGFCRYIDYFPRSEGNFFDLDSMLNNLMPKWAPHDTLLTAMQRKHHLAADDAFAVVRWAVIMCISRGLPVEHGPTLAKVFENTDFLRLLDGEPKETQYSIPVMCPLLDLVNHSAANDNIAVMVPDHDMKDTRPIVARALRSIPQGEEVTMRYGICDPHGMRLFYGIDGPVLP